MGIVEWWCSLDVLTIIVPTRCTVFLGAVHEYKLPSRLRCDQGKENYTVAAHMLENRGTDRNSVIVGSSVHNHGQRIERLWRDMHRCVTQLFYRLFYYLEQNNYLNPVNEMHIMALHFYQE